MVATTSHSLPLDRGPEKVGCGPVTLLQSRLPSHDLHRQHSSLHVHFPALFGKALSSPAGVRVWAWVVSQGGWCTEGDGEHLTNDGAL